MLCRAIFFQEKVENSSLLRFSRRACNTLQGSIFTGSSQEHVMDRDGDGRIEHVACDNAACLTFLPQIPNIQDDSESVVIAADTIYTRHREELKTDVAGANSVVPSCSFNGEKPYHCKMCDKQFSQKSYLYKHLRTHTGEKPFRCTVCDKQFTRKDSLNDHLRIHTGEKSHHCKVCNKRFLQKARLTEHLLTHKGEKPYHCKTCEKQFSKKCDLENHIRTHTGEKPYHCKVCNTMFSRQNTLNTHFRIHTFHRGVFYERIFAAILERNHFIVNYVMNSSHGRVS